MANTIEILKNIVRIVQDGKKPIRKAVFHPDHKDRYDFKGKKYSIGQLSQALMNYECIYGPFVIITLSDEPRQSLTG